MPKLAKFHAEMLNSAPGANAAEASPAQLLDPLLSKVPSLNAIPLMSWSTGAMASALALLAMSCATGVA